MIGGNINIYQCHDYINNHVPFYRSPENLLTFFFQLEQGGPEMKFIYFHYDCWGKNVSKMIGHMAWISQESPKLY